VPWPICCTLAYSRAQSLFRTPHRVAWVIKTLQKLHCFYLKLLSTVCCTATSMHNAYSLIRSWCDIARIRVSIVTGRRRKTIRPKSRCTCVHAEQDKKVTFSIAYTFEMNMTNKIKVSGESEYNIQYNIQYKICKAPCCRGFRGAICLQS